jgi:ribonuclease VapC
MFIDASAIISILVGEADAGVLFQRLASASTRAHVSPLAIFEAANGLARAKSKKNTKPTPELLEKAEAAVAAFARGLGAREIPVTPEIGKIALEASRRFGKSVGHEADLNFGDCFAYACAKASGIPLLFKGNDFSKTDLA